MHRENGRFARTIVNRYWRKLLGRGIVEPADDMDAEPWDEDLLDWLASDFAANGYRSAASDETHHDVTRLPVRSGRGNRGPRSNTCSVVLASAASPPSSSRTRSPPSTGDWRVNSPRTETYATYAREWRLKSDPLSRALGASHSGPGLHGTQLGSDDAASTGTDQRAAALATAGTRVEGARWANWNPRPRICSTAKSSEAARSGDVDITGARELWLLMEDVDSYDPPQVIAGWANAELVGPQAREAESSELRSCSYEELTSKTVESMALPAKMSSAMVWISPARVHTFPGRGGYRREEPAERHRPGRAIFRVHGEARPRSTDSRAGQRRLSSLRENSGPPPELTERLYAHLLPASRRRGAQRPLQQLLGREADCIRS